MPTYSSYQARTWTAAVPRRKSEFRMKFQMQRKDSSAQHSSCRQAGTSCCDHSSWITVNLTARLWVLKTLVKLSLQQRMRFARKLRAACAAAPRPAGCQTRVGEDGHCVMDDPAAAALATRPRIELNQPRSACYSSWNTTGQTPVPVMSFKCVKISNSSIASFLAWRGKA